jgi:CBS domain-containing protein
MVEPASDLEGCREINMRAHQIMTRDVITVGPDASMREAASLMLDRRISGLPVLDKDGKLIGIISEGDFVRRAEIGTQRRAPALASVFCRTGSRSK